MPISYTGNIKAYNVVFFSSTASNLENAKAPQHCGHCNYLFLFSLNPHVIVVYECILVRSADVLRQLSDRASDLHAAGSGCTRPAIAKLKTPFDLP